MKRVLLVSFRKTYSVFSLSRHAILEVTSSLQTHTLLGYLAGKEKHFSIQGLEVFYVWPNGILEEDEIADAISDIRPDIVAVSLLNVDFGAYLRFRRLTERLLKRKIVWIAGGYLPTSAPLETLKQGRFDFLVRCHGEVSFHRLLEHLSTQRGGFADVPNLIWEEKGKLLETSVQFFPEEEAKVRLLYEPFSVEWYVKESWQIPAVSKMKYLTTWFSRGCPYDCGFCLNREMNRGTRVLRDPDLVIDEIFEMNQTRGVNYVFFADENFLVFHKAALKMLETMVKRGFRQRAHFTFMTDVKSISQGDPELLPMLKEAGCEEIQFGVESGSQFVLGKMHKNNKRDQCFDAFQKTFEHGMMSQAMMVLGYDGETVETLDETEKFIRQLRPDRMSLFFAVPFDRTEIYESYRDQLSRLPFFFFDSDFPIFSPASLQADLEKRGWATRLELDGAVKRVFDKYAFSLSSTQSYLMDFREKMMYRYYISDNFIEKQGEVFLRRTRDFGEDRALLLDAAKQWFTILERSIGWSEYAETSLRLISHT